MKDFKQQIEKELKTIDWYNESKEHHEHLKKLAALNSHQEIIDSLKSIPYPLNVQVIAKSIALQNVMIAQDSVTNIFSEHSIKAIIYQACKLGNLGFVRHFERAFCLDFAIEELPDPFSSCTKSSRIFGKTAFAIHAATSSDSIALMDYLLSFYYLTTPVRSTPTGVLQTALVLAVKQNNSVEMIKYLLSQNISPNAKDNNSEGLTALHWAISNGNKAVVDLLVEQGATIDPTHQEIAVRKGQVEIVEYFISKGIEFPDGNYPFLRTAFISGSVAMVSYFLNILEHKLYKNNPSEKEKKKINRELIIYSVGSGSTEMMRFLEKSLHIPIVKLISEELETTDIYDHIESSLIMLEAVYSNNVAMLQFLFEEKNLTPNQKQLQSLLPYTEQSEQSQQQKLQTHAYLYSYLHNDTAMRKLLLKVAQTPSLNLLKLEELFIIYANYKRFSFSDYLSKTAYHIAKEISRRDFTSQELLNISVNNRKLSSDIQFYLTFSGKTFHPCFNKFLNNSKYLTTLNFSKKIQDFTKSELEQIAQVLEHNSGITKIDFSRQALDDKDLLMLLDALNKNPHIKLKELNLSQTAISYKSGEALINYLKNNPSLTSLKYNFKTNAERQTDTKEWIEKIDTEINNNEKINQSYTKGSVVGLLCRFGIPKELGWKIVEDGKLDRFDGRAVALVDKLTREKAKELEQLTSTQLGR